LCKADLTVFSSLDILSFVQRVIKLKADINRYKAAGVKAGVYICKAAGAGAGAGVQNCKTAGAGAEKPEFAQH
jgi:hypothetical protein